MKTALGKGLNALIPDKGDDILYLDIDRIVPGRQQPRKAFDESALKELAASIKEKGVLQPIIVSRNGDGSFSLIAGERRWRASVMAGIGRIPALVKNVASKESLEIALIENIQREDLNPIETADAFDRLMKDFGLTQEELSDRVGKERATVANYLRLIKLPSEIKAMLSDGILSMGHARALLSLDGRPSQVEAAKKIIKQGLSVREAESLVNKAKRSPKAPQKTDPQISSLEEKLTKSLATKVRIRHKGKRGGTVEIDYYSLDELQRLLDIMMQ